MKIVLLLFYWSLFFLSLFLIFLHFIWGVGIENVELSHILDGTASFRLGLSLLSVFMSIVLILTRNKYLTLTTIILLLAPFILVYTKFYFDV